jgi:hypothetical protein
VATRDQVTALLDQGHSYETVAGELGIPAGLAYMIATGKPAGGGAQHLVHPAPVNPTRNETVTEWVRARASRELQQLR